MTIGETSFTVLPRTKIKGPKGLKLRLSGLQVGEHARAILVPDSEGNYLAMIVHIQRNRRQQGVRVNGRVEVSGVPVQFELEQNDPNPFNPSTTIAFNINQAKPLIVSLAVYNVLGQRVATLIRGELDPGRHEVRWDGKDDRGFRVESGIYLYRLEANDQIDSRSMILMK